MRFPAPLPALRRGRRSEQGPRKGPPPICRLRRGAATPEASLEKSIPLLLFLPEHARRQNRKSRIGKTQQNGRGAEGGGVGEGEAAASVEVDGDERTDGDEEDRHGDGRCVQREERQREEREGCMLGVCGGMG